MREIRARVYVCMLKTVYYIGIEKCFFVPFEFFHVTVDTNATLETFAACKQQGRRVLRTQCKIELGVLHAYGFSLCVCVYIYMCSLPLLATAVACRKSAIT